MTFDLTTPRGRMMATLLAGIAAAKARGKRLVGREMGLSRSTVAEIVKRNRTHDAAA